MNKSKIKILHVLEATVGGTRQHLLSLLTNLNVNIFQNEVAAPKVRQTSIDDTSFERQLNKIGIPHHYVDMAREIQPISDLRSLFTLIRLIHQNKYDLVHVHSSKAGFLGRVAAKINRVPTVYTPNGFYFLDASHPVKEKFFLSLEKIAGRLTDKLIAVSDGEARQAITRGVISPQKLVIIPNAINFREFEPDLDAKHNTRSRLGISPDSPIVGTVSRFIPQKNPFALVRSFAHIHQALPNVHFVWCGEGDMRSDTEQLAENLGIASAISFLGYQDNIKDIMNTFDVFMLASVFEGLPYTILEAMALALPVVATDVIGSQDIVKDGETGFLVKCSPSQPYDLAESVIVLLKNETIRTRFGIQGRQIVKNKFGIEQMTKHTEDLYLALTNNH